MAAPADTKFEELEAAEEVVEGFVGLSLREDADESTDSCHLAGDQFGLGIVGVSGEVDFGDLGAVFEEVEEGLSVTADGTETAGQTAKAADD